MPRAPQGQLSRAALFALGAAAAAATSTGCSAKIETELDAGATDAAVVDAASDAGTDALAVDSGTPIDARSDTMQPAYGGPPPQDAGVQPPYGQPPPPDAGIMPMYGAPPP